MDDFDFEMPKSRVYVRVDEDDRIVQIEGEYSLTNLGDLTAPNIHLIDEGPSEARYNHAQNAYLEDGLRTEDGICRWKLAEDGDSPYGWKPVLRSEEELEADRAAIPPAPPTAIEVLQSENSMLKAQVNALIEQNDFQEELIVELANEVYA